MARPYEITTPHEILTDEIVTNLQIVFQQFGLSMKDAHVKLADSKWKKLPLRGDKNIESDVFCSYVRNTEPFKELCEQDRASCREQAMNQVGKPVQWHCPFGLQVIGIGFQIGRAEVVLRSGGWLERGNEGLAINKTLEILQSRNLIDLQNEILPLFKKQLSRTDAEVRKDAESLKELLGLVRDQARAVHEHNVERSKEAFLQEVKEFVVPLMAEFIEREQMQRIQDVLTNIATFFELESCAFYFTQPDNPEWLTRVAAVGYKMESVDSRISRSLLDANGPHSIGLAQILKGTEVAGLSKSYSKACVVTFPNQNAALLLVLLASNENTLLDDRILSELTRTLSIPICVASLVTGLKREAELRRIQARNTAHTVRSTFQGVAGDIADIRRKIIAVMGELPNNVEEPLEHVEELIRYMNYLLLSYEIVEHQFLDRARPLQLDRKIQVRIWNILDWVRESFRKRASALQIDIVLHEELRNISPVEIDSGMVSLLFMNLLNNALKYSHRGNPEKRRTIDVTGREDNFNIYIEIADFGLGIHPLEEEAIFEPYVQGSVMDKTRSITGQGIGLAAAQEIARIHGGYVVLERCIPYREGGERIPSDDVMSCKPDSPEASDLLQHCLVVFEVSLPKKGV